MSSVKAQICIYVWMCITLTDYFHHIEYDTEVFGRGKAIHRKFGVILLLHANLQHV